MCLGTMEFMGVCAGFKFIDPTPLNPGGQVRLLSGFKGVGSTNPTVSSSESWQDKHTPGGPRVAAAAQAAP